MVRLAPLGVSFVVWALSCGGTRQPIRQGAPPVATPPPPPGEPTLDLDAMGPLLSSSDHDAVREAVAAGDLARTREALGAAAAATDEERRALRILSAWARRDVPRTAGLVDELLALAGEQPLLAPWMRLWAAERAIGDGDLDRGAAIAAQIPPDGPAGIRARLARADAAWARRDHAAAEPLYRAHVEAGRGGRILGARLRAAQAVAARANDPATAEEAATLAFAVRADATDAATIRAADEVLRRVVPLVAAEVRARFTVEPFADRIGGAERDFEAHRSERAEAAWREILEALPEGDPRRCRASLRIAQCARKLREHTRAANLFDAAAVACQQDPDRAEALFLAARSFESAGDDPRAIAGFEALERELPSHRYADDARLRRAELLREAGDLAGFRVAIESIPRDFPDGDMRGEALFRPAIWARRAGDLDLALVTLQAHLAAIPREDGFRTAGRTLYWRGRVLDAMGRRPEAIESWTLAIRQYPLSFYSVVALGRLEDADPGSARETTRTLQGAREADGWRFALDDDLRAEPFRRAVELLRLGLREEALAEIEALGWDGEDAPEERRWLVAVLLSRAGDPRRSHEIVRRGRGMAGWERRWPIGPDRKRWELAFPRPFGDVVAGATTSERLPPDLLHAIMREESAFDAGVESWANAVGLMQLIGPTARRFAAPLSLPHDARSLRRPEVNVRIGAAFVRFLLDQFDGAIPLAVAGYNAGETAVARWLDACPSGRSATQSLDEWVEAIPYDETRGYTKRVIATYATYRFLAGGWDAVPRISATIEHPACAAAATASR